MNIEETENPATSDRPSLPPVKVDASKAIIKDELLDKIASGEIQLNYSYLPSRPLESEPLDIDTTRLPLADSESDAQDEKL